MLRLIAISGMILLVAGAAGFSQQVQAAEPTKATYLITGLHCPPCTRTVQSSLSRAEGIRSVKVDWNSKNATIEFDESVVPAQKVAKLIGDTPHMMGGGMQYAGWLALKAPEVKDEASGKKVTDALGKVAGVKRAVAYPAQHSVGIQFAPEGSLTSHQLIEELGKNGVKAENY